MQYSRENVDLAFFLILDKVHTRWVRQHGTRQIILFPCTETQFQQHEGALWTLYGRGYFIYFEEVSMRKISMGINGGAGLIFMVPNF